MRLIFGNSNTKTVRTNDAINIANGAGKSLDDTTANAAAYTLDAGTETCELYSTSDVYELRTYCM